MSSPATPTAGSPRRLGRYTILEALAKGGMAQVFIAQKDNAPEICVLKQLLGELETHATAGKRFYREAHVASYLQHPRIARTIDAGFEDDAFCIAMEFIAGRDVESLMHLLMRQGRMLPYELSLSVALGVLEGLEYAHDARDPSGAPLDLVHRDLSPRNVMLSYEGDVKIIDFGLARGRVDDFKTAPGMILGTLRYVSPEQAVADPIDRRSDLYSIAVVLYEMLSGRPLVRDGKALDVLTDVVQRVPEPLTTRNPHLPKSLDPVLAQALAKDPGQRYQTARELRLALEQAAGTLARTPKASIGEFITSLFPQEREKAMALLELGRRRYAEQNMARGGRGATQVGQRTLAGDVEVGSQPDDLGSRTRTGFMDAGALGGMRLDDAHGSQTRTGWVAPVGMTPLDLGLPTRTVVEPTFLDPHPPSSAVGVTTFDAPLPYAGATLGMGDATRMTGPDGRTVAMELGSRTLIYPPSSATPAPVATPPRGSSAPVYALGAFMVLSVVVIVAGLMMRQPEEVHVIEAQNDPPPIAAPMATAAAVVPEAMASPATPPVEATPAPSTPRASPTRTAEARPTPEPRRAVDGTATKRAGAPARVEDAPASVPPAAPGGTVAVLARDIARFRGEWDDLEAPQRAGRFIALAERLREAADDSTRGKVSGMVRDDRMADDRDKDVGQLEAALELIKKGSR